MVGRVKIGCCGFPVAKDRYYREFEVVEIQKTFYQPPSFITVQKWRERAPSKFEFTVKAWQLITHLPSSPTYRRLKEHILKNKEDMYGFFRPTEEVFSAWKKTEEIASVLKGKIIVFQSPPGFKPTLNNEKNLREFFNKIERRDFIFVWEPRGKWEKEKIRSLCNELNLIHCVDPFKSEPLTQKGIFYFRLHGKGGYRYRYTKEDLFYLYKIVCALPSSSSIYVMFNNTYMFEDATRFKSLFY